MVIPGAVIVLIVLALIGYGEYKEWRGEKQGEAKEKLQRRPYLDQELKLRDEYWLNVLRVHSVQPPAVVLQLGENMEIRQKPAARKQGA